MLLATSATGNRKVRVVRWLQFPALFRVFFGRMRRYGEQTKSRLPKSFKSVA